MRACSITGLAGPDGGTAEKPVGLGWVYMVRALKDRREPGLLPVHGNRGKIREQSAMKALDLARRCILAMGAGKSCLKQEV